MKIFRYILQIVIFIAISAMIVQAKNSGHFSFCSLLPERHVYKETPDSIIFISGMTQIFTADTSENEGLTPTTLRVEQLVEAMPKEAEVYYNVFNSLGRKKTEGTFESGDYIEKLNVKTGKKQTRKVGLQHGTLRGRLSLEMPERTAGSEKDIILHFYAGQRSPMTEVIITIPNGIRIIPENTFINVIGRGEVEAKGGLHFRLPNGQHMVFGYAM